MEPWRPGVILFFLLVKVLSWNEVRVLSVSQISMLAAWELGAGVNGAHELLTPDMAPMALMAPMASMEWWCREVKE